MEDSLGELGCAEIRQIIADCSGMRGGWSLSQELDCLPLSMPAVLEVRQEDVLPQPRTYHRSIQ